MRARPQRMALCRTADLTFRRSRRVRGPHPRRTGRPRQVELHAASWQVKGAALDGVTWVRTDPTGEHATEGNVGAHAFTGASPAFLVAISRLLRLEPGAGAVRVRLVAFTDPVLAPLTLDQSWALRGRAGHTTDTGPLVVDEYEVSELDTGEVRTVHIAGDVVLAAPGIELEDIWRARRRPSRPDRWISPLTCDVQKFLGFP
ncbi:hypothetical protein SANTM175S_06901 [Streptomyces antimycoticus]